MSEIPGELIAAVKAGAEALNRDAAQVEQDPLFKGDGVVGKILRTSVERYRLQAAMLIDWCNRNAVPQRGIE